MSRLSLLFSILGVAALTAAIHILALAHLWYFFYPWLDLLTHFLGGFLIGLAAGGFAFGIFGNPAGARYRLLTIVAMVLLIGVLWEWFELVGGIPKEANYNFDTSLDLLVDLLGGIVAAFVLRIAHR